MGFLDFIFGKSKEEQPVPAATSVAAAAPVEIQPEAVPAPLTAETPAGAVDSEIVAVIAAAIAAATEGEGTIVSIGRPRVWATEPPSPEVAAVIAAAIYAAMGTANLALRITRTSNAWAATGRQKIMDGREFAQK